ncbi:hypothetical protein NL676_016778 [Syzygium grande]|nr:hypothetical protein NL676_016778 [Syzygium grande]
MQRNESLDAFFDDYVSLKTSLKQFVEQYDNALKSKEKKEKENEADYCSSNLTYKLVTDFYFEKQFYESYTNDIFRLFQDELGGLLYCNCELDKVDGLQGNDGKKSKQINLAMQNKRKTEMHIDPAPPFIHPSAVLYLKKVKGYGAFPCRQGQLQCIVVGEWVVSFGESLYRIIICWLIVHVWPVAAASILTVYCQGSQSSELSRSSPPANSAFTRHPNDDAAGPMAKYGEGDKRWIVEERPDGTNVHNWHWSETNCLEWSRNLLTALLSDLPLLDGQGDLFVRTGKVEKVEGEAYVNIRKGKIIPGYEISVVLPWEGEARDSDGKSLLKVDGTVEIPYIADENADEDPEVRVLVKDDGPIGRRLKEAMVSRGKPVILEKVRVYVESMARGGPAREDLETKKVAPKSQVSSPAAAAAAADAAAEKKEAAAAEKKEAKKKKKEGFKTISMTEKFSCRARDMYEILMDENRWKGFTQSNARISKEVGGEFSIFDGSVTGTNVELQEGKLIMQKWRFGSWPDGIHSTVKLTLDEPEPGLTVVKLTHTDVPEEDRYGNATVVENTERGWRDLIFHKIRAVFGFGI